MNEKWRVQNGWYRLIKWQEDGNLFFPDDDMVVEVRNGLLVNVLTGRQSRYSTRGAERSLFGPLTGPYDSRGLRYLRRIDLSLAPRQLCDTQPDTTVPCW